MTLPFTMPGCVLEQDDVQLGSSLEDTSQELVLHRSDQISTITPHSGYWGGWKQSVYCEPGTFVSGYKMRVEGSQGGGDDTALNAVQLHCRSPSWTDTEWISSHDGVWGGWYSSRQCNSFVNGARMRVEGSQGSGDDTAANDVQMLCSTGGYIHAPGGTGWGGWGNWAQCPSGSAVCGISSRFEDPISGDDTAMNGMKLHCCSLAADCHPDSLGGWGYCTSDCPCESGQGDCDTNSDCAPGLTCIHNVGANFGWYSSVDVCL